MKERFVEISSLFENKYHRNIEELSKVYNDKTVLYQYIKPLVTSNIEYSDIHDKKVLVKPNWVRHALLDTDDFCLCTNNNFILVVLEVILEMYPREIVLGDAPIQGADWCKIISEQFKKELSIISDRFDVPIYLKDFRLVKFDPSSNKLQEGKINDEEYIIFDVGTQSYLESITSEKKTFRVTCYPPDKLSETHSFGVHKYCVVKDVFDSDTIITLPKIKTHQKSGLTNSLKILVGVNGDKNYLPHHRIGSVEHGGDCYKGYSPFRSFSEYLLDIANKHRGKFKYKIFTILSSLFWKISLPNQEQNLAAGWYGNDTVWRMVMDLNLIATYGKLDGSISKTAERSLYTICDGIIGGQGNGPLSPEPLPLGIITISNDYFLMDEIVGYLLNLNIDKIPLLKEAKRLNICKKYNLRVNGQKKNIEDLKKYSINVKMPPGWINYDK